MINDDINMIIEEMFSIGYLRQCVVTSNLLANVTSYFYIETDDKITIQNLKIHFPIINFSS